MKRLDYEEDALEVLVKLNEKTTAAKNFDEFIELFRRPNRKIPKTIRRLILWRHDYFLEIYVIKTPDNQLELCLDRVALLEDRQVDLKTLQSFERCLASVKPKLIVLASTHDRRNPIKRYGFHDIAIFGRSKRLRLTNE